MSLQIWLPLTDGTLKQQGLSNAIAATGGTVGLTDAGKLGKCATIGTAAGGITLPASTMTSFTECSVVFWIKIISWNTSYATFFQAGLGSTPWNNYMFGILRNNANSNLCFTLTNNSGSSTNASYVSSNLEVGQWYHLAFTYKAGTACIYKDGVLDKTYSTTYVPNFAGITHISIGRSTNNSNYQTNCNLNDFRIYDHCLSPIEVKELSKGLVLHYPLNRGGWGQENLLVKSGVFSSTSGWTNNQNVTLSTRNNELKAVINQTDSTPGIRTTNTFNLTAGTYIASLLIKVENGNKNFVNYPFYINNGTALYNGVYTKKENRGDYVYEEATFTLTSNANNITCYILTSSPANGETWYLKWIKLEKGSIATPWCPNSSDALATTMGLNSTTEYDCSGFCNNGTRIGTFDWTSNTAKYAVSTKFNGTDNAIQTPSLPTMITDKNYTIAVWIYKTVIGSKGYQTIYGGPSGFEIEARNGGANETKFVPWNWGKPMASYELNEWNHCVFVHSDADCKIYLNGEYIATGTAKASNPTGNYFIGAWNTSTQQNFDGLMSDFRIYATALSADDVKSLYQNCATIDPDGTIRGQIRS